MILIAALAPLAHLGNIPVEEWLPFVAPLVGLYVYGRRHERRRRKDVGSIPKSSQDLDAVVVDQVVAGWRRHRYEDVIPEQLALLYPPGPDGMTVSELAAKTRSDPKRVEQLIEQLEISDYLYLEEAGGELQAALTLRGYGLVDTTENSLLTALRTVRRERSSANE